MSTDTLAKLRRDLEGELLARRDTGARDYSRYVNDPVGFAKDILRAPAWEQKQVELLLAVRDHPLVVARGANSVGKDRAGALLALWWFATRERSTVLLTSATERQVREVMFGRELRPLFLRSDLPGDLYAQSLRGPEDRLILGFTSNEASRLTGFHSPGGVLCILSEAQGLDDVAFEAMLSCATGVDDRVLAVGNPLAPERRFYTISRPGSSWHTIRISALDHPNVVNGNPNLIPGGVTEAFVQRIAGEYGKDSPQYVSRVLAQFPEEGENTLIRTSWLERAAELHKTGALEREAKQCAWTLAVDVARGTDLSSLCLAQGPVVREITTWNATDLMHTVGVVMEKLRELRARPFGPLGAGYYPEVGEVTVDAIGLGSGVIDRLREQDVDVREFWASGKAEDPQRFLNARAEAWWNLRTLLERAQVAIPFNQLLHEELAHTSWKLTSAGKILIGPKQDLRLLLNRSPDRADSVVMALYSGSAISIGGSIVTL
jgi:hypothetical protein